MPESMESYYQESGRVGRDGLPSEGILLVHPSDKNRLQNQFLSHLPDSKYLEVFYKKLCDYLEIAYGEGEGKEYKLNFNNFCSTYEFQPKKAHYCLGILAREDIFEMKQIHETQTYLKISSTPLEALKRS